MARPERPLSTVPGPVRDFAAALRELRQQAGAIPYRQLAKAAHFSPAHLARAADGRALPRWEVVSAYVRACGGDLLEWQQRWQLASAVAQAQRESVVVVHMPRMRSALVDSGCSGHMAPVRQLASARSVASVSSAAG
ncbi:helix-turn-helix transcriptional regulator [Frankia sp. AgPm24]|uniref:helix-turn-helix domain-containing protein n=1 Tax=Frankia sp. AgPm24 TaxID=631128 RepID=UPI00200E9C01|nr:helix-turn-helix transcriptional regulator [Frankia sp. AgPm24]MCK9922544.1 helix-turn-helix transcriptional regulator [Frankia sp. AgPm24]